MLRFAQGDSFFEMDVPVFEDVSLQSVNGSVVVLRVRSSGYAGENDLWVHTEDLHRFAIGLVELERSLRGEARLTSMSPNELDLKVLAVSSRGHLAVQGTTGHLIQGENQVSWDSVSFGFEFEPSQLSAAVAEPWVRKNAG
ncbi:hypothetical protein AACH06_29635 [Ideonella sp. DXS29W]|uniref:Uncharacterized protein n=1 Tax=Ideonella lacteola TaxID=2984193 RepID=A0ABU9BZX1_9BURK